MVQCDKGGEVVKLKTQNYAKLRPSRGHVLHRLQGLNTKTLVKASRRLFKGLYRLIRVLIGTYWIKWLTGANRG